MYHKYGLDKSTSTICRYGVVNQSLYLMIKVNFRSYEDTAINYFVFVCL